MNDESKDESNGPRLDARAQGGTVKVAALGMRPKHVTLPEDRPATVGDLIEQGFLKGGQDVQYFINSVQVNKDAIVRDGDAVCSIDKIDAGR